MPRTEPGISVSNSPTPSGAGNFFIRGIGDNRVRLEIDGVRVPDYPGSNVGAGLYTRDFVDYDSLKRVEIIRGPASALYGSDAIGGVVSFVTKDPGDYLREVGRDWYAGTKLSFNGIDRSFSETFTGAAAAAPGSSCCSIPAATATSRASTRARARRTRRPTSRTTSSRS
ncbi:MAG: TonB-dependent receptor plug domain-containing protein [Piscinibacter sp.]